MKERLATYTTIVVTALGGAACSESQPQHHPSLREIRSKQIARELCLIATSPDALRDLEHTQRELMKLATEYHALNPSDSVEQLADAAHAACRDREILPFVSPQHA